jgi:hypothetical protein
MSSSESNALAGPLKRRPSLPVIFATAPSGARVPRRIWMWPESLIGAFQGWITSWPSARPCSPATFSASVRPVTVLQSPCIAPSASSSWITAGMPPTRCRSSIT